MVTTIGAQKKDVIAARANIFVITGHIPPKIKLGNDNHISRTPLFDCVLTVDNSEECSK